MSGKLTTVSAGQSNPKWEKLIKRQHEIYQRPDELRSEFWRDYNRILHSNAYRRLKHKTQVFFATKHDHVCTRLEHVNHVASVSFTIASELGLNTELVSAISIGHDLGHAPFGHSGERILARLVERYIGDTFWHEKNSLRFADKIELLYDPKGAECNLNLTYAVRDGIISHCGEVDDNFIVPRDDAIDLSTIEKASEYAPFTWEGCVVKIADKIAYLGRDIEDAMMLKILTRNQLRDLKLLLGSKNRVRLSEVNNTVLMHNFIIDLCNSSSIENGIRFSHEHFNLLAQLKKFSAENIYKHERLQTFIKYAELIIQSIFDVLQKLYAGKYTLKQIEGKKGIYPILASTFSTWLKTYSDVAQTKQRSRKLQNEIIYTLDHEASYIQCICDFISGMTDNFAIRVFNELTSF